MFISDNLRIFGYLYSFVYYLILYKGLFLGGEKTWCLVPSIEKKVCNRHMGPNIPSQSHNIGSGPLC